MDREPDVEQLAGTLRVGIGLLIRRMRQLPAGGGLTMPELSALARIDRGGPATSAAIAKLEQITPQAMGATLSALEGRGLLRRDADPHDGRRVVLGLTEAGLSALRSTRDARTKRLAAVLGEDFTRAELDLLRAAAPLIERLAERI